MKRVLEIDEEDKNELAERIASASHHRFNLLSSRGKPSSNEWTHLAAFVAVDENDHIDVISLGTGTKCLGGEKNERGTQGCLLHDSHAEVIARRSLLRLFYDEIIRGTNSTLVKQEEDKKFVWNESLRLYLFVSYPPCGAAAYLSDPVKRPKFEHKSLNLSNEQEQLYLKPGKGYQTTSLSCTNKINRWIYQGLEGSLLNQFIISPVKLSGLVIQTTVDLSSVFKDTLMISVKNSFECGPSSERTRPCAMSMAWWKGLDVSTPVVTVDGYPLGQVKRLRHRQEYASPIAKCSLFKLYLELKENLSSSSSSVTTYAQAKAFSSNSLRDQFMTKHPGWLQTDSDVFYSFTINSSSSSKRDKDEE
ncbi:unnamed protein product [Adineta ricciae]|uniref:tRNA-specific adenosine deaminase 1 n=1 Tax=Adineta ricciae TaxID=249248 RepID=A0A813S2U0_ADIRI|nr:unnamed protein product [Adineta ricciae]CAF1216811.1 unnamed protein product [Adineta ricciae]